MIYPKKTQKTKWYNSNWTIGIVCAVLPLVVPTVYDAIRHYPFLYTISKVLGYIWDFLNINIRLWVILVVILSYLMLRIFVHISRVKKQAETPKQNSQVPYINYTTDRLKKWRWSWEWTLNTSINKMQVAGLKAHCPVCDTAMLKTDHYAYGIGYKCPRCNINYDMRGSAGYEDATDIDALIIDNVHRGNYPRT